MKKYHRVEYQDRCEMIPIDASPLEAVRAEIGDSLDGVSIEELREEALARARRQAPGGPGED